MASELTPDLTETIQFLDALPSAEFETLGLIKEGAPPAMRSFTPTELAAARAWLASAQGSHNSYYHANASAASGRNRKARKSDIAYGRMLHVDIDDLEAIPRIEDFPVPPSVVVFSGGGYQCLWFLDEPEPDLSRVEHLNRHIASLLGGDKCHSADHLLRLPGTLNVPNAKKRAAGRTIVRARILAGMTDYSRRYRVGDIEAAAGLGGNGLGVRQSPSGRSAFPLPALIDKLSDFTKILIVHGDDPEHPRGSAKATYPSRSEAVFRVATDLVKAGADEAAIKNVLLDPENGISASILEAASPEKYAARQAMRAYRSVGEGWPNVRRDQTPYATFPNALVALGRLDLRFHYDELADRKRVTGFDGVETQDLSDDLCSAIRLVILGRYGFDPGKEHVRDAAEALCLEERVHPVRDYLDALNWDGKPRIRTWLSRYLGAENTAFHRAVGRLILAAAVRRVRSPGVKFDTIPVFEGPQGSGKSTAIMILAGAKYFSDQEILQLDAQAQMEAMEGVWLYELGELQGLNKADVDKVKSFASRTVDRARRAYGRFREDRPRQLVFIGTTNDRHYLRDPTGNRRFWPVRTEYIDLEAIRRDRDQLWAEAVNFERRLRSLALPGMLWGDAQVAQAERFIEDPWFDQLFEVHGKNDGPVARISTKDVFDGLAVPATGRTPPAYKRLVSLMHRHGWEGPKLMRIEGNPQRGYERPVRPPPHQDY